MSPHRRHTLRIVPQRLPVTLRSGIHEISTVHNVVLTLEEDGAAGSGFCFAFREREAQALAALLQQLVEDILELDWSNIRGIWRLLWESLNHVGQAGPGLEALAAVDTALWDLFGRQIGQPLYKLWGAARDRVPAYASGGWLSYSTDELLAEATGFAAEGFRRYKMKIGGPDLAADIARVQEVIAAVGPDVSVMVDANQAYSRSAALRMGRLLTDIGVDWFEEPVDANDFEGSAQVAAAVDVRVAAGETVFGVDRLRDLATSGGVSVLMPDLMRCGGLTPLREIATVAAASRVDVSPHLFPEYSAHVAASSGREILIEHLPRWWEGFYARKPQLIGGELVMSDESGLGVEIAAN